MLFQNMTVKDIEYVISYKETSKRFKAENRKNHIIGVAFSGEEIHDFGYKSFCVGESCIYFFNQKDDYSVVVNEPSLCHSVHFTTYEEIETDSFCFKVNNTQEFERLIKAMESWNISSGNGNHILLSDFHKLCAMFCEVYKRNYRQSDERMQEAINFLNGNFRRKECLDMLYSKMGISRRHTDKLFKEQFNTTPNRYIIFKKTELAKQLLQTPNLSIGSIAELCGFSDVFYFCKVFKAYTNMTPTQYKKISAKGEK